MEQKKQAIRRILAVCVALVITVGAAWGIWRDSQDKFRDVTVYTGGEPLQLADFLTEYGRESKARFVTDMSAIDPNRAGQYPITLCQGQREQTVKLTILDVQAPAMTLQDLQWTVDRGIPTPEDFVVSLEDHSQVTLTFAQPLTVGQDYADAVVQIIATDASGNEAQGQASVHYLWLREQVTLEYGRKLSARNLLYSEDLTLVDEAALAQLNEAPVGTYTIDSTLGGRTQTCTVVIQDTTAPNLKLKEHCVLPGTTLDVADFVESASDVSGNVTLTLLNQPDTNVMGTYTVTVEAADIYGNTTTKETKLRVVEDIIAPTIWGTDYTLVLQKHSEPDYLLGVGAYDNVDTDIQVEVDAGMVDLTRGGTYYVIYTARDQAGNVTEVRRKVTVTYTQEDTDAMAADIASELPDDPELIRDYVRNTISYSTSWGGDDPIWYGFSQRTGNCYVHAMCLKALLNAKGYNTQLIWVTNRTHYWLIIEIEPGVWRHIDPTPGSPHNIYSLMTDEERLSTLKGRKWYFSHWPACE